MADELAMSAALAQPEEEMRDGTLIRHLEDGGMELDFDPEAEDEDEAEIDDDNLAEGMSAQELSRLAQELIEFVDADIESRKDWHEAFRNGLAECAIDGQEPTASRAGGATVVHPLIAEAAVQFQARAIAELFPASGPVKGMVIGDKTQQAEERARRVESHMNWQMIEEDEGYYDDLDQMLLVLPFAGSTFKRTYWDDLEGRVTSEWMRADNVIIPYGARSIRTASRVTVEFWLQQHEMDELRAKGVYLDEDKVKLQRPTTVEQNETADTADKATATHVLEGDGQYHLYEVACWRRFEKDKEAGEDGRMLPYLITLSVEDQQVLSIRRNWVERNGRRVPRQQLTHYKYLPGMGVYGWGLFHWIGSLNKAATGALRGLLDAAAANNFQGGFASKEVATVGKDVTLEFGKWKTVNATSEDLRNGFFTPPFKEPSNALVSIFEALVSSGQRFGSTTEAMVGEGRDNVPVGTTIARIEQASKVYSGIHRRLHTAAKHEFRLRAELNRTHLQHALQFSLRNSNLTIAPEDYSDAVDVIPVSDPNMVSLAQRVTTAEAQIQLARANPANFDIREVERRYLEAIQAPDIDRLMIDPDAIPMMDPVTEGVMVMTGQAVKAYPEQDHQAHMAVHAAQMQMIQGSPAAQLAGPALQAHMADHMAQQYRVTMSAQLGIPIPDPGRGRDKEPLPPEIQDAISLRAAMAAQQQQQQQAENPPPEMQKIMAEAQEASARAKKAAAESEEVAIRTLKARQELATGDDGSAAAIAQAMAVVQEVQAALAENFKRDQAAEVDRMNLVATVRELQDELQAVRRQGADAMTQRATADGESVEIRKAQIDAAAKVEVAKVAAADKAQIAALQGQIDELKRLLQEATTQREKEEKDDEGGKEEKEKPEAPTVMNMHITVDAAKSGSKSIAIKRDKSGAIVGAEMTPEAEGKE